MVGKFITFLNCEILGFLTIKDKVIYHCLVDTCSFMISIKDIVKFRSIRSLIQKNHCQ